MDFGVSSFIAYFLAYSGIIGVIWFLFSKAEDTLKSNVKKDISKWLKNLDPEEPVKKWPGQFAAIFDRVFGKIHLSWKRFRRSSLASLTSSSIIFPIWWYKNNAAATAELDFVAWIFVINFGSIVFNLLPDYLSLIETRWIIRLIGSSKKNYVVFGLLLIDLILTTTIFLVTLTIILLVTGASEFDEFMSLAYWLALLTVTIKEILLLTGDSTSVSIVGIFLYTTYFTSIWVWLYALSGLIVKLTQKLNIGLTWFKGKFDINQKPLRSMAMVSIMIVTIIFIVVPFM